MITHTVFDFDEDTQYDIHYLVLWIIITHTVFGSIESQMMTHAAFGSTESQMMTHAAFGSIESQMMTHAAFGSTESPNKAKQLPSRVIAHARDTTPDKGHHYKQGTQHQTRDLPVNTNPKMHVVPNTQTLKATNRQTDILSDSMVAERLSVISLISKRKYTIVNATEREISRETSH